MTSDFSIGVIEGFFGRPWSWKSRFELAAVMQRIAAKPYVYAPKSQPFLRRRWKDPFPSELGGHLMKLRSEFRNRGVSFGIGLTPMGTQSGLNAQDRKCLEQKLSELKTFELDVLCVLFDDMHGENPNLAASQLEIMDVIRKADMAPHIVMCPTYYSDDPILENVFGRRPEEYWKELGTLLPPDVDIFWTGPRVVSKSYTADHLYAVASRFGRPVILWDNHIANDGEKRADLLFLKAPRLQVQQFHDCLRSLFINPMNQAALSMRWLEASIGQSCNVDVGDSMQVEALLRRDSAKFEKTGLNGLSQIEKDQLISNYSAYDDDLAIEIIDWLQGGYEFDPACLTD